MKNNNFNQCGNISNFYLSKFVFRAARNLERSKSKGKFTCALPCKERFDLSNLVFHPVGLTKHL